VISAIIGGLIGFFAAVFAEPLRQLIYRPKVRLEFGNTSDYRARTLAQDDRPGIPPHSVCEAYYIRIKVTNTKPALAKKCRAYLVAVEKADETGQFMPTVYCDSIPLPWACRGDQAYDPLDLPRGVPHYVELVSTRSVSTDFQPKIRPFPFRYVSLFSEHGTFRLTILVSGGNIKPVPIRVVFGWAGVWDKHETWLDNTS
jgi:hypothetical protein